MKNFERINALGHQRTISIVVALLALVTVLIATSGFARNDNERAKSTKVSAAAELSAIANTSGSGSPSMTDVPTSTTSAPQANATAVAAAAPIAMRSPSPPAADTRSSQAGAVAGARPETRTAAGTVAEAPAEPATAPTAKATAPAASSKECANPSWTTSEMLGKWDHRGWFIQNNVWNTAEAGPQTLFACGYGNWYVV